MPHPQTSNDILPLINEVLPDDILAEILTHSVVCSHSHSKLEQIGERCTPAPVDRSLISKVTSIYHHHCISTPDPLLLSQVCSRWRDQLQLLQLWLARSGQLPISIFFRHHEDAKSFRSLFQLLSSIDLIIYKDGSADTPARIEEFISPNSLKSLEYPSFVDDFARILFQSSSLHTLKWGSASIYHRVPPSWLQLRSIELFKFNLTTLTAISACKQLEKLHIIDCTIYEMGTNNAFLRLISTGMNTSPLSPMDNITVLILRALFLKHVVHIREPHSTWDAVKEMLLRSACSLEKFSFIDKSIRFSEEHLSSPVFSRTSENTLVELTLASLMLLDRVISRLSMVSGDNNTEDSHGILPNLKTLELRGCSATDGATSRIVSSRCQNKQASLSRIQVRTNAARSSHVQDVDVLETLAREGLQVDLGHNYRFHV
ncbi:hypothetical protein BDZ97DRAFT_1788578 [Flammula alnicola]|nr:hypothetical protein BDZ97DRAFT_1788578 [Flammula alnicola]